MNPVEKIISAIMGKEAIRNLSWLLEEVGKWQEPGYDTEIEDRIAYLDALMRPDMLKVMKKEFPKTHDLFTNHLVNFPIVQDIADKRARVFENSKFELVDSATRETIKTDTPESKTFSELIRKALIHITLDRADHVRDICHAAALKAWWDQDHVATGCYSPDKCKIAPNPLREWDPYSARAVLFQRTGIDGLRSIPRYEIWGTRDPIVADDVDSSGIPIFPPTLHFVTDSDPINDKDENPLKDPAGKPFIPFVWLTDDANSIYDAKGNNLVDFNRVVNIAFTQTQAHMSWGMLGYPVYRKQAGSNAKVPPIRPMSPAQAMELPTDISLEFVRNDVPIEPITNTYQLWLKINAMLSGIDPATLRTDSNAPESGYAIKVRVSGVQKRIKKIVPIYQPNVDRFLNQIIWIWNYYLPTIPKNQLNGMVAIPSTMVARWIPGELESGPSDLKEMADRYTVEIPANVSTPDDWVAERWNLNSEDAKKRVDANAKRNQDLAKQSTRYPIAPGQEEPIPGLADRIKTKKEAAPAEESEQEQPQDEEKKIPPVNMPPEVK